MRILQMIETGTFIVVKKLFYSLAFVLLALVSVGASAHAGHGDVHNVKPQAADMQRSAAQEKQNHAGVNDVASKADASHIDTCDHSHCGHAQTAGLLTRDGSDWNIDTAYNVPTLLTSGASSHITNNIERPKWRATTPAVVSHLS